MFEQTFKNIDDILHKDTGCGSELDYVEQTSWVLFLKYLDDLEKDKQTAAELSGKSYNKIIDDEFQRHIGLIRPKNSIDSKWLFYWILYPQAVKPANETATAHKTVSLKSLQNFSIPSIPLDEQQQIVQQLDSISTQTKKLETIYEQKINNLDELKKSILQKTFRGEL